MLFFLSAQAHEVQREESFPEQAMLQTSLGQREMNLNIKFPADAKLKYLSSSANNVDDAHCEFDGNMLLNSAEKAFFESWDLNCKFKVTFSEIYGNECSCELATKRRMIMFGVAQYSIDRYGCDCMRITLCEGNKCSKDNAGGWPCGKHDRCVGAPQVTLTVESTWE